MEDPVQIDKDKLANLPTFNQYLDDKYGKAGSPQREQFDQESLAWYYGTLLKERRKQLNLTQRQVAERTGTKQSYIARVERGLVDLQMSSFTRLASVLGIQMVPTYTPA